MLKIGDFGLTKFCSETDVIQSFSLKAMLN